MSVPGLRAAWTASEPRWPDMCARLFNASTCLLNVSLTSMSTWWVLCLLYAATHTCSLWWTVQHIGPRPAPSKIPPQQLASTPSLSGSPVWGHCHCDLRLRLPVHFLVLVCLLSLCQHPTRDDDRLPPSVQQMHWQLKAALVARRSSTASPNSCLAHHRLSLDNSC